MFSIGGCALLFPAVFFRFFPASCGSQTLPFPSAVLTPTATPVPHAPEIRLALIGGVTSANVWALFDAQGYSYNNYAVRSEYWPRLYRLSIPGRQFEPMAASDMPSLVQQAGDFYTATVPLRSDLSWSNGSSFTAEDVAFTVNAALSFKLGFDWRDYYNPAVLDHAEALNSSTVKYYFKQMPDVGAWQYSVLQGPIVQKAYWASKVSSSAALLPPTDLGLQIDELKTKVTDLQQQVDALQAANGTTTGEEARQTQASLTRQEGDLDQAINDLAKAQSDFDAAMSAARQSLYALGDGNEPRLGIWEYSGSANRAVTNEANPDFPLGQPNFDRAVYQFYPDQDAAVTALANDEVDVVLALEVLSSQSLAGNPAFQVMNSPTHSLRFLVFNPLSDAFGDAAVRQALACMLDQDQAAGQLPGQVLPLKSFVLPGESFWYNPDAPLSCKGLDPGSRLALAIQILKTAGYTWTREPAPDIPGQGLASAAGERLPAVSLIAPSSDAPRAAAAWSGTRPPWASSPGPPG